MSIRKASVLELATYAYELEAGVLRGVLERNEDGNWAIGGISVTEWLTPYTGKEVVFIAASLEDDRPMESKVCRTCGREYEGVECSRCRQARQRLRGW